MNDNQEKFQGIADALAPYIANAIAAIRSDMERQFAEDRALAREDQERFAEKCADDMRDLVKELGDNVATRFDRGVKMVTETAEESISAVERASVAKCTDAITRAEHAVREAEVAKAEAEEKIAKAKEEREAAEKASAMLALQGTVEVDRMTAEVAFEQKRKRILAELKAEESSLGDEYDRKADYLQKGVIHYFPDLAKNLEEIENQESERGEEEQ